MTISKVTEPCSRCGFDTGTWMGTRFDRTVCPAPCGSMHNRCAQCGAAQDGCPLEATKEQQPAVVEPPADQTTLRDRIAEAMRTAPSFDMRPDWTAPGGPLKITARINDLADAVLAVLPAPADRATVEADADTVATSAAQVITTMGAEIRELKRERDRGKYAAEIERLRAELESERDASRRLLAQRQEMAEERYAWQQRGDRAEAALRRMADETATETPQPRRGDAFEQWLKAQRNRYDRDGESSEFWHEFDGALDQYRLHADTGAPLGEHVCEGKTVGDCECLEQPAAGARQDGAQR